MGFLKKALGKSVGGKLLGKALKKDPLGSKLVGAASKIDPLGKKVMGAAGIGANAKKGATGGVVGAALRQKAMKTGGNLPATASPAAKKMTALGGNGEVRRRRAGRFNP